MNLLDVQVIAEVDESGGRNDGALKVAGIDILPVEDGFFAVESVPESNQTAIQQGEALVMDGINEPPGGYVVRRSADDGTENVNMSPPVPIHGSHLNFLPNKENVVTLLADQWSETDGLGQHKPQLLFNAWIDYQPRFIYI